MDAEQHFPVNDPLDLQRQAIGRFGAFIKQFDLLLSDGKPQAARSFCLENESTIFGEAALPSEFRAFYFYTRSSAELRCNEIDRAEESILAGLKQIGSDHELSHSSLHADFLLAYAKVNLTRGRTAQARAQIAQAAQIATESPDRNPRTLSTVYFFSAEDSMGRDDISAAELAFERAFEQHALGNLPKDARHLERIFEFLALKNMLDKRDEALALFEQACELKNHFESLGPINCTMLHLVGCELLLEKGAYSRAREHANAALKIKDDTPNLALPRDVIIHMHVLRLVSAAALIDKPTAHESAVALKKLLNLSADEQARMSLELRAYYDAAKASHQVDLCKTMLWATSMVRIEF